MKGETKVELAGKRVGAAAWSRDVPVLTVKNFSCIKKLTVEFRRIVVFIGEQASGKSVTCKLYYFFRQALRKVAMFCLREEVWEARLATCDFACVKVRTRQLTARIDNDGNIRYA